MERKFILLMTIGILAIGCPSQKVMRYETVAYKSASPENRLKIEQGKIDVGMSIEECRPPALGVSFLGSSPIRKGIMRYGKLPAQERIYIYKCKMAELKRS